jgi:transcriptional regulator with GAF, ATPase, and Fis domain
LPYTCDSRLVASTIHYSSNRADRRFLTINCAALTDTLLESQLFGHVKGAFTGAVANHSGLVEEASGGTLFLDEIGDLSAALQAKLLRLLQEKEFIPVGSTKVRHADVRFVAATNQELETEVRLGRFREDLFYRLNVVNIQVPPLRERKDDIPPLAQFFASKYSPRGEQGITSEALTLLYSYHWPGNVRELENVIEMAVILADGAPIRTSNCRSRSPRRHRSTSPCRASRRPSRSWNSATSNRFTVRPASTNRILRRFSGCRARPLIANSSSMPSTRESRGQCLDCRLLRWTSSESSSVDFGLIIFPLRASRMQKLIISLSVPSS